MNTFIPRAPSVRDLEDFLGLLRTRDPRVVKPSTGKLCPEEFHPSWFPWLTVIERDRTRYRYRLIGEASIRFLGENLRGKSTEDLAPQRAAYLKQAYGQILELGNPLMATCEYLFSNGSTVPATTALVPLKNDKRQSDRIVLLSAPDLRASNWLGRTDFEALPRPVDIRKMTHVYS